ncbi:MAG TPA: XrtA/PEP-CTERM system TPR-repeat protein PrsT [Gammaproteobacteria bacterium]|nr:XrtA/PEP-CTERM system TPR-repeat protein PrsT [Gammaproteobacteria bacterium]
MTKLFAAAALGLALAACNQSEQAAVSEAQQDAANGEYSTALIKLKNYLRDHPQSGKAWLLLGKASLRLGQPADAESELRKAEKYGAPAGQVALPLARALLVQGKGETLLTQIKPATVRNTADRAELLVVRGDAYLASDKPGEAEKSYKAALQIEPNATDATVGMAKVALANEQPSQAKELLQQVLRQNPDAPRAWLLKAHMAMQQKQYADAVAALQRALSVKDSPLLPQQTFMARAEVAEALIRQDKLNDALEQLKPLNKAAPDQPYSNYLRALVAYRMNDYMTAESSLQRVLRVTPSSVSAQMLLGAVNIAQGQYGQAEMHLSNVIGIDPKNAKARKLMAMALYKGGQSQQALNVIRPVVGDRYTNTQLLAMMSKAGSNPENDMLPDAQQPKNSAESLQFARRYILSGRNQSAVTLLERMPAADKNKKTDYQRERLLIVALLRQGQVKQALDQAHTLAKAHPEDAPPEVFLGGAYAVAGHVDKARKHLNLALKLDPDNELARMSLASISLKSGDNKSAEADFKHVLDHHPDYVRAMLGIAQAEDRMGHTDKAVAWVKKARKADSKAVAPRLLLVRYYARNGKPRQALDLAEEAADIAPNNPVVLNALGIAQLEVGDKDAAIESFKSAADGAPKSANFRTNLARAEIAAGQFANAGNDLQRVVDRHPDYVPAVSLYALTQLQSGRLFEGVALAKSLRDKYPATAYALEGDLYVLGKQFDDAVDAYRNALKHKQTRALVAKLLTAAGAAHQKGVADTALTWIKAHPDDVALRASLGDYYMSIDRNDAAIDEYEAVIAKYPNNVQVLNNMAWLYAIDRNEKAVTYAQKAHKMAPKAAEVTDTLGWALLRTGEANQAVSVLRKAVSQAPKSATMRYHLASALAQAGNKDEARDLLKKLLASNKAFSDRNEAEQLYSGLNSGTASTK